MTLAVSLRVATTGAVVFNSLDGRVTQRVNVDFPEALLQAIDREARRIGVTRQAFIKLRLADVVSR